MFFRRPKPKVITFAERLETLRQADFSVRETQGGAVVTRGGCAVVVDEQKDGEAHIKRSGWIVGREIGELVDLGYQKVWKTASGVTEPALADHLKSLHDAQEDVKEILGLPSFYNESLGTVNDAHLYDRVEDRDRGVPKRAWER